jgi:hypothetical protein
MSILGERKQEAKLAEFGKIAKEINPNVDELAVKGAFRFAVKSTIEKSRFSNWAEVTKQPPSIRKNFFASLIRESKPRLDPIIGKENLDNFVERIMLENEKYLK